MQILDKSIDSETLSVTLRIEPQEFEKALHDAYLDHAETYVVPGYAPGLAPREKIEETYGLTALYDEALDLCVPQMYHTFLAENNLRTVGKPQLTAVTWLEGGASFTVTCDLYPQVQLGAYKHIEVTVTREKDEEAFAAAVLTKACTNMTAVVPDGMVQQRLNSMIAQEKLQINQDPIYHLLADTIDILEHAYHEVGINRPKAQVRAEALDAMLQTVSKDNQTVTQEFFTDCIRELVSRYRSIPNDMDAIIEQLIQTRKEKKRQMSADEKADAAFDAYLGSLELTEKQWRTERSREAENTARFDLLLHAVAEKEQLAISTDELHTVYVNIANQCGVDVDEVIPALDRQLIREQLLRDKARTFILDHAVSI